MLHDYQLNAHEKWSILYRLDVPSYFQDLLGPCFSKCPWTSHTRGSQKLVRNADSRVPSSPAHREGPVAQEHFHEVAIKLLAGAVISSEGSAHVNSFTRCLAPAPHDMGLSIGHRMAWQWASHRASNPKGPREGKHAPDGSHGLL